MADDTTTTTGSGPDTAAKAAQDAAEKAAPTAGQPQQAAESGAGSKDALKADLAAERDRRQAAEKTATDTAAKLDAVLKALGLGADGKPVEDPAAQAAEYKRQVADRDLQLAVLKGAPAGVDAQALLDSRAFLAAAAGLDPADGDAVCRAIDRFVADHPRFRAPATGAAARDLAQQADPAGGAGSDPLVAALSAAVGRR